MNQEQESPRVHAGEYVKTKPPDQGTGVGLYFAHDLIVTRHGGQIKVDSQPGAYTKFTVILPIKNF